MDLTLEENRETMKIYLHNLIDHVLDSCDTNTFDCEIQHGMKDVPIFGGINSNIQIASGYDRDGTMTITIKINGGVKREDI